MRRGAEGGRKTGVDGKEVLDGMAADEEGLWGIEARAFRIRYTPFTHNFWVLTAANGKVADQLHGLAVDPLTGAVKAIGSADHLLQVVRDASLSWALKPGQPAAVCASGRETDIFPRWQAAVAAIPAINALALRYPNLWQHAYRANCNSIFTTLGLIMGFSAPAALLPTLAPGSGLVISPAIVERYRYRVPPPTPAPAQKMRRG